MTRTVDLAHRESLLDRVSAYVLEHGVSDLSLRPLAEAVGMSPRTLLYHFGSKEELISRVMQRVRARQLQTFDRLRSSGLNEPGAICKFAWAYMTAPDVVPMLRLFFETYMLALRDPQRFPGFLESAVEDWLAFLAAPARNAGADSASARAYATLVLAGYRGFMLDFVATGDRERIGAALDLWVDSLNVFGTDKGCSHAE